MRARRSRTVFKANVEGPWIDPDAASAEELVQVALNCPSGAIHVTRHDGGADEAAPEVNTITVRENGPLAINAEIVLAGAPIGTRATLCRCGASKNKPYCDGSHVAAAFTATGEPPTARARRSPNATACSPSRPIRTGRSASPARSRSFPEPGARSTASRDCALPLRTFRPQAILRRYACQSRIHRALGGTEQRRLMRC